MKLFACMCNQPQRLAAALAPVRATLLAQPPVKRWGLGYVQGGDVLLVRTPKSSEQPVDLAAPLFELRTDCAIALAVRGDTSTLGGTDNTPPFRFRRWMYAQTGMLDSHGLEDVARRLLEHVPEYLRRNIKGRTPAEVAFHLFLAMLHDGGQIDDPNLPVAASRRALAAAVRLINTELEKAGKAAVIGNVALTNGRSMVVARIDEPLRLRRLYVTGERGEREDFRGVIIVSGGDGDPHDGFEDVPGSHCVLISRDLKVELAELAP
jgi:predicted glutamine amidotransferase